MKTLQYFIWVQTKAADDRHKEFTSSELGVGTVSNRAVETELFNITPSSPKALPKCPFQLQHSSEKSHPFSARFSSLFEQTLLFGAFLTEMGRDKAAH